MGREVIGWCRGGSDCDFSVEVISYLLIFLVLLYIDCFFFSFFFFSFLLMLLGLIIT